jgi:urease accessory protein
MTGLDHLLVMLGVGVLAVRAGGRAMWGLPAAFVTLMALGGLLARSGVAIPAVEQTVAASVCVIGLLLARVGRLPIACTTIFVGGFAIFHGYAHMFEAAGAEAHSYAAGFLLTTATLHAFGMVLGILATRLRGDAWLRAAGVTTCICGIVLAAGAL